MCAEELRVCYNANDCDDNEFERKSWEQVGELWEEAGSCLYDDDDEDVWECLDDALDDWLDDNMHSNDDYDDLEDEEEDDRGFTLEDYEDDLDDVGNRPSTRRSETVLERYQRQWAARTPISIYQSMNEVDTHGPSFRSTADEYLTVNFTTFLESTSPYQICNTTIGCVTVTTYSNTFRSYMQNLHIVIQDRSVMRCMDRAGWDVEDDHAIPFDNPRPDLLRRTHEGSQRGLSGQGHRRQRRPVCHVGHRASERHSARLVRPGAAPAGGTGPGPDSGVPVRRRVR